MSRKQNFPLVARRSVIQGYAHFLMDARESRTLKLVPLIMMGYIPVDGLEAVIGDVLAPFTAGVAPIIASVDDAPVGFVVLIAAIKMIGHIRSHMSYELYPERLMTHDQSAGYRRQPYPPQGPDSRVRR